MPQSVCLRNSLLVKEIYEIHGNSQKISILKYFQFVEKFSEKFRIGSLVPRTTVGPKFSNFSWSWSDQAESQSLRVFVVLVLWTDSSPAVSSPWIPDWTGIISSWIKSLKDVVLLKMLHNEIFDLKFSLIEINFYLSQAKCFISEWYITILGKLK